MLTISNILENSGNSWYSGTKKAQGFLEVVSPITEDT